MVCDELSVMGCESGEFEAEMNEWSVEVLFCVAVLLIESVSIELVDST